MAKCNGSGAEQTQDPRYHMPPQQAIPGGQSVGSIAPSTKAHEPLGLGMQTAELVPPISRLNLPAAAANTAPHACHLRRESDQAQAHRRADNAACLSGSDWPARTADARRVARAALVAEMPSNTRPSALAAHLSWCRSIPPRSAGVGN
eukprot:5388069-Prymnesium_polylepis.2